VTWAFFIAAGLFCLKILWNVSLPYALARRLTRTGTDQGVSLMPGLEIALLAAAVVFTALAGPGRPLSAGGAAVIGVATMLASYGHLIVVGRLLARRRSRGR
jgi:hypothetical protein